ncbi:hypothetical protein BDV35DRAFT_137245 [Aspergillus flavus]|uniref:Uncharacterized protein n=1 Tax=Aspergillus flavus TaxID=5059 RepID=A0A5N6H5U7_ASPFL|nr:hypothetical protein BDV35DRAFT_137245 [Aspergillus flavus]
MILNCRHCPLRYFSIIQNSVILGVVSLCIAECYARILEIVDTETKRLERNSEHKRVRFSKSMMVHTMPVCQATLLYSR